METKNAANSESQQNRIDWSNHPSLPPDYKNGDPLPGDPRYIARMDSPLYTQKGGKRLVLLDSAEENFLKAQADGEPIYRYTSVKAKKPERLVAFGLPE